jgi:hypothetical protein
MKKHKPLPVSLEESDVQLLDSYPFSRHSVMIAAIRAGLEVLAGKPENVFRYNQSLTTRRVRAA